MYTDCTNKSFFQCCAAVTNEKCLQTEKGTYLFILGGLMCLSTQMESLKCTSKGNLPLVNMEKPRSKIHSVLHFELFYLHCVTRWIGRHIRHLNFKFIKWWINVKILAVTIKLIYALRSGYIHLLLDFWPYSIYFPLMFLVNKFANNQYPHSSSRHCCF